MGAKVKKHGTNKDGSIKLRFDWPVPLRVGAMSWATLPKPEGVSIFCHYDIIMGLVMQAIEHLLIPTVKLDAMESSEKAIALATRELFLNTLGHIWTEVAYSL